ncbi:MAG: hypothetical protein FJX75_10555 [Armatimonadetes bacterium]|nr:hypothetical protein [Armatimonadota bacterium]
MNRAAITLAALGGLAAVAGVRLRAGADSVADPMGPNGACYVCHMTFVREELAKTHLAKKVTCVKCHGLSAKHANDEDIGATKPDRPYTREQVNAMCRKCHRRHDVPPEDVVARWVGRKLTQTPAVCTDCHGTHRIERAETSG